MFGGASGGGGGTSAASSSSTGTQFGNNVVGDYGGSSKSLPLLILGGVSLALIGGLFWMLMKGRG